MERSKTALIGKHEAIEEEKGDDGEVKTGEDKKRESLKVAQSEVSTSKQNILGGLAALKKISQEQK